MSNDDQEEEPYNDTHRAFLQALIAKSTLTFEEAQSILAAILSAHNSEPTIPSSISHELFTSYIATTNDALSIYDLEIRRTRHQDPARQARDIYALINLASDPATQLATSFTPDELAYVKRVLDAMFETNNTLRRELCAVLPIQAAKLHRPPASGTGTGASLNGTGLNGEGDVNGGETQGSAGAQITILQAERVLAALVDQGWFEKSRRNYYSLSPRALMELRGWLEETYNDDDDEEDEEDEEEEEQGNARRGLRIKFCHACKDIVTYGQRCPRLRCPSRFHDSCAEGFFRMQRTRACPACKTEWTGQDFVGERAALDKQKSRPQPNPRASEASTLLDESGGALGRRSRPQPNMRASEASTLQDESGGVLGRRSAQQEGSSDEEDEQ